MKLSIFWVVLVLSVHAMGSVRVVETDASGVTLNFSANGFSERNVTRESKVYREIRVKDFEFIALEGAPELPRLSALVMVPDSANVSWSALPSPAEKTIALTSDIAFSEMAPSHEHRPASRNDSAYARVYGKNAIEIEEVSYAGTDRLARITFHPFFYDAAKRTLRFRDSLNVRLNFSGGQLSTPPVGGIRGEMASLVSVNAPKRAFRDSKIDLIIAHEMYEKTLFSYLEFKRSLGREVRFHSVGKQTADQIKAIIAQEYKSSTPPNGTMLVGSIDQIPSWKGSGDNTWSDYSYQTLDSGTLPDVAVGRIPAQNLEELRSILSKIVARETEPRDIDQILLTAGRDTALGCPANVSVVGDKIKVAAASIKVVKRYRTDSTTQQVYDGYNDSPNIVVYDGHGNRQGMSEIPLNIEDLDQLKNKTHPIVLDIACLNANWPSSGASSRNFAESILMKKEVGVAGIMASGGSGYGHDFFQTIGKLMAEARKQLTTHPALNEIGRVIMTAKVSHGTQDKNYWNYYGDPSTSVW